MSAEKTRSDDSSRFRSWAGEVWAAPSWRVVVPVLDEEKALPALLAEVAAQPGLLRRIIFVDNGSTDGSPELIRAAGGRVVLETRRGYGYACLAGVTAAVEDLSVGDDPQGRGSASRSHLPVVAFMEGDGTDDPAQLPRLVGPILSGDLDLVVGSRRRTVEVHGGMPLHQRVGNVAAVCLLKMLFGIRLPDNGPFRAIRADLLEGLGMEPRGYAWTTEMVVKAHLAGARIAWVDTSFRTRAGRSKIAGSVRGTIGAFRGIFGTMLRLRVTSWWPGEGEAPSRARDAGPPQ